MPKKIVVLGAGFAGVKATKKLSKSLGSNAEITLIDRHSYQTMLPQIHEVAAGRVPFTNVQYDLSRLFGKNKNVHLVTDEVVTIDKEMKFVETRHGKYDFDYLLVSMGAEPADFGVKGVKEFAYTLWSLEDAIKIKHHLENAVEKASNEIDPEKRKAMLNFSVAGSGFSGIEMMGELIEWRDVVARDWKIDPEEFTLNVVEMMPTILNTLDRKQADKAMTYMKSKGVNFLLNHGITEVGADFVKTNVGGRDEEKHEKIIPTRTLIWTTGIQGNTDAVPFKLKETERGHRLQSNEYMQAIGYEGKGIYVAGDVSGFIAQEGGRPQPQIVEAADQTGETAAENIIAEINGQTPQKKFDFKYSGTLVSVGGRYGVAVIGKSGKFSGFLAIFLKSMVYLLYTLQVKSLWYFFTYLKNEFFHTPNGRNSFHGHVSRLGNVLWTLPLRIFFGIVWLQSGIAGLSGGESWIGTVHSGLAIMEIILGILFILGAFTFLAAIWTAVFAIFSFPHILAVTFFFVAISLLNGAGRSFGLDKWIQPGFQKWFFGWWYQKPRSIYKNYRK